MWCTIKRVINFEFGSGKPSLKPGRHNLTDEQFNQWFVPGLIASGDIVVEEQETPTLSPKKLNYGKYEVFYGGTKPVVSIDKEEVKMDSSKETPALTPVPIEVKEEIKPLAEGLEGVIGPQDNDLGIQVKEVPEPVVSNPEPVVDKPIVTGQRRKRA